MKRLIALAASFALAACVLVGCGRAENNKTTNTTTTPSTIATEPRPSSTAPTTSATQPSSNADIPEASSIPNDGMDGNSGNNDTRSRTHYPSVIGRNR